MENSITFHLIIRGNPIQFNGNLEDRTLALLLREFNKTKAGNDLEPVQQAAIQLVIDDWSIAQAWVFQLQSKSMAQDEYPFNTEEFQTLKPCGEFLNALLELCGECHNFLATHSSSRLCPYRSGKDWWRSICFELSGGAMQSLVYQTDRTIGAFKPLSQKKDYAAAISEELRELKSIRNPYNHALLPHLYNLIAVSITILTNQPDDNNEMKSGRTKFRKNAWEPYIGANQSVRKAFCQANGNLRVAKIRDEKLIKTITGKQEQTIYPPPSEKFFKQSKKPKS